MSAPAVQVSDGGARQVRNRQILLLSGIVAAALLAVAAWLLLSGDGAPAPDPRIAAELAGPGTAEESWIQRSEARVGGIEADLKELRIRNRQLADQNHKLRVRLGKQADEAKAVIDALSTAANGGTAGGTPASGERPGDAVPGAGIFDRAGANTNAGGRMSGSAATPQQMPPLIRRFQLDEPAFNEPKGADTRAGDARAGDTRAGAPKPLSRWLPAGSHARAVVLAGVDASAGIAAQGDPRPALFRITGPAWTAAKDTHAEDTHAEDTRAGDGTAQAVDLDGCTVTAAAYGDLSSEKVYARLKTLTCAGPEPGTVVETEVAGFVAGSGKAGVRGPVVSREGALVEKAFLAGLVSGLGQGAAGAFAPQAVAAGGGAAVANTGLGDIGRAGLGAGASSAGRKVADYLIRRAEQYQPVIQLQAGTPVTVVFLEGTWLAGAGVSGASVSGTSADGRPQTKPVGRKNHDG